MNYKYTKGLKDETIESVFDQLTTYPLMTEFTLHRQHRSAQYFKEPLSRDVNLEMILIPGGTFLMGSPEDELDRDDNEGPQHPVTVAPFFLGRYPVTQSQWKVVSSWEVVNQSLEPNPSHFKGKDCPVEQVSWHDAIEFCQRLSRKSDRTYQLPTEAEWEYACRAGTTPPFHFGETITTDLANYDGTDDLDGSWSGSYGRGPKGINRQETTPVGSFPANAFGLHDMHGNVWEWCMDPYHPDYKGAPGNSFAWIVNQDESARVLRGGSWHGNPKICRSAYRLSNYPDVCDFDIGFRVVCVSPQTL